jgi:RNA-binding protein YhbY
MLKHKLGLMQIGKNGLTENFFMNLENEFKNHENVKIVVLKNAGHEKKNVADMNTKILERMGNKYTSRVIGFTINLKKWRKAVR